MASLPVTWPWLTSLTPSPDSPIIPILQPKRFSFPCGFTSILSYQFCTLPLNQILISDCVCVCVLVAQSSLTLWDPINYSLPGSSVHGIFQAKVLEWVAIPFSRASSQPRNQTGVFCISGRFFTVWATSEAIIGLAAAAKSLQSCPTLCDPRDGSPPDFPASGILLKWIQFYYAHCISIKLG